MIVTSLVNEGFLLKVSIFKIIVKKFLVIQERIVFGRVKEVLGSPDLDLV